MIAAILEREPAPLEEAPPLERVVRRLLAKDPDQRFQTARDLEAALTWALEQPPASATTKVKSRMPYAALAMVFAIVAAVAFVGWWRATRPIEPKLQPLVRLDVDLGTGVSLASTAGADVILSPDGKRLVYVSQSLLFTRPLDQPKATELIGTEGAYAPFFSPDGQWVAFFTPGKKKFLCRGAR